MISISDFNGRPDGSDTTPAVRAAVGSMRRSTARSLVLPAGRYDFWPDLAGERYLFVSNNDEGLKRIAFDLSGLGDVEIDGQGSLLVFHGGIVPFVFERSARVRLTNLSIDWATTFHTEATVVAVDGAGVDVQFGESFAYRIEHGRLTFPDETGHATSHELVNILEFDPRRRETAFMAHDNYGIGRRHAAYDLGQRRVRFTADFREPHPRVGNVLAMTCGRRPYPAIVLTRCAGVDVSDVTIHHAHGMGVIAQRCHDVSLRRVAVVPSGDRLISTTADATHFVGCTGHTQVINSRLENQLDDPLNCHGVYGQVGRRVSPTTVDLRLVHPQQLGYDLADVACRMEFVRGRCLSTYHEGVVASVDRINRQVTRVTFDRPLPTDLAVGDAAVNADATCDLTVRGNVARGNRARGFLVSTPGTVVIEDNAIHTAGAGVLIEGDANYWFESGAVRDVTIRRNLFDNCNYGVWGHAAVQVTPAVREEARAEARFHRNIRVERNTFITFGRPLLHAHNVDGLTFRDNTICGSTDYPSPDPAPPRYHVEHCSNVTIADNEDVDRATATTSLRPARGTSEMHRAPRVPAIVGGDAR